MKIQFGNLSQHVSPSLMIFNYHTFARLNFTKLFKIFRSLLTLYLKPRPFSYGLQNFPPVRLTLFRGLHSFLVGLFSWARGSLLSHFGLAGLGEGLSQIFPRASIS